LEPLVYTAYALRGALRFSINSYLSKKKKKEGAWACTLIQVIGFNFICSVVGPTSFAPQGLYKLVYFLFIVGIFVLIV
jgi:hypothetical protein